MSGHRTRLLVAAVLSGFASAAAADDYHYNNMLVGDRANGMGGAYAAVSDDPAGLFYNPAGIIYAGGRNLSASVNAFKTTTTAYKNVLGGKDWIRESAALLPNFFGVIQPLGPGVIGFSYAVTDSISENQDTRLTGIGTIDEYIINVNNDDNTYKIGPSYAMDLSDDLSVGLTLYGHYRSSELIFNQTLLRNDAKYLWSNIYLQALEFGVEPVFGLMWSPLERWSVGLSARQTYLISADVREQQTVTGSIDDGLAATPPPDPTAIDPIVSEYSIGHPYPLELRLGAAWFPTNRLILSGDFMYYTAADGARSARIDHPVLRSRMATWNVAFGAEYYLSDTWALRSGFFTRNANTPTLVSGSTDQPEHVDLAGLTMSFSRFTRTSSLSAGFAYAYGSGQAQIVGGELEIQAVEGSSFMAFLSTSYTY